MLFIVKKTFDIVYNTIKNDNNITLLKNILLSYDKLNNCFSSLIYNLTFYLLNV